MKTDNETPAQPEKRMPCGHKADGRNLIVCIDGTMNKFGRKNTNVIELYNLVMKETGDKQRTWYNSGIGTYARRRRRKALMYIQEVAYHGSEAMVAQDVHKIIQDAYRWLSDNYKDGDCIFLFGFSRGAFQVRALSAMIEKVGLIHKGNETQIPFAYELYTHSNIEHREAAPVGAMLPQRHGEEPEKARPSRSWVSLLGERLKGILGITKNQTPDSGHSPAEEPKKLSKIGRLMQIFRPTKTKGGDLGSSQATSAATLDERAYQPKIPLGAPEEEIISMAERFKLAFSRKDVKVHFVGVWDTVSSVGGESADEVLPGTTDGMTHVCYFRHALALDERRVKFLPEYACGATTLPTQKKIKTTAGKGPPGPAVVRPSGPPQVLEVWFGGTHSDIGGGNKDNVELNNRRPSLRWMVSEAASFGLRLKPISRELWASEQVEVRESLKGCWHLLELFPFRRSTFSRHPDKINTTTHKPHLGSPRKIHEGQKIHISAVPSEGYTPKAQPPPVGFGPDGSRFWKQFQDFEHGLPRKNRWLEFDVSDYVRMQLVKGIRDEDASGNEKDVARAKESAKNRLTDLCISKIGAQALYDEVIQTLMSLEERSGDSRRDKALVIRATIDVLNESSSRIERRHRKDVRTLFQNLMTSEEPQERQLAKRFQMSLVQGSIPLELNGHTDSVLGIAISPDGKRIVSCSKDESIRIWDFTTGKQGKELRGHEDWVTSIAISHDGTLIVSASCDMTIRIWDQEGNGLGLLEGHIAWVTSVAITPDGRHIVSGSDDETILVWDVAKKSQVGRPLVGHRDSVTSVAITPDGKRIISGSKDNTIRTWDLRMRREIVGRPPIPGHEHWVGSVAMLPDGNFATAGNNTICVWDAKRGVQMGPGQGIRAHRSRTNTIAVSSDGVYLASGSQGGMIRVWNVETKVQAGVLLGHTAAVNSVAFTADRRHIVSGADDGTIRIWDMDELFD